MTAVSTWNERHGPSNFKICFTMTCTGESEIISRSYVIDNLVLMKFKGNAKMAEDKMKYAISFSLTKHDMAKQNNIKVNIESKALKYSAANVDVPNAWSDWIKIGYKLPFIRGFLYSSTITIVVDVYEDKKESLLTKLYTDNGFTEFNLATSEGSVPVHKACMAAHSDLFKAMLKGEWKEVSQGEINIPSVTIQTLQQLKDYMYLGIVNDEGLRSLLLIARCYHIEDLEKQCIKKLVKKVTGKELFSLVQFACENNIPELAFNLIATTSDATVNAAQAVLDKSALKNQK